MVKQINKGCALPVYSKLGHQVRFVENLNKAFGLPTPRTSLLPFQIALQRFNPQQQLAVSRFSLVDLCDESVKIDLPLSEINKSCNNERYWFWHDGNPLEEPMPCGYYYAVIEVGTDTYYTEVMHFGEYFDKAVYKVNIESCTQAGTPSGIENRLTLSWDVAPASPTSSTLEYYDGSNFVAATGGDMVKALVVDETVLIRLTLEFENRTVIRNFSLDWNDQTPCDITITDITND